MARRDIPNVMTELKRNMREAFKKENEPFVPPMMVIYLKQITKKRYDEMKRSDKAVGVRPLGFMYVDGDERRVFVTEDNVYYEGINMASPYYTPEMFQTWNTKGVETYTMISLDPPVEEKSAA